LVVVIVGGGRSGAALGALISFGRERFGSVYFPTYSVVLTFVIMVVVLAFRPQGLMGTACTWWQLTEHAGRLEPE
jgi:branched-chain amino acid transport system permease protein